MLVVNRLHDHWFLTEWRFRESDKSGWFERITLPCGGTSIEGTTSEQREVSLNGGVSCKVFGSIMLIINHLNKKPVYSLGLKLLTTLYSITLITVHILEYTKRSTFKSCQNVINPPWWSVTYVEINSYLNRLECSKTFLVPSIEVPL